MRRPVPSPALCIAVGICLFLAPAAHAESASPRSDTRLVVKFRAGYGVRTDANGRPRSDSPAIDRLLHRPEVHSVVPLFGRGTRGARVGGDGLERIHVVRLARPGDVDAAITQFRALPQVEYAEPDYVAAAASATRSLRIPNDPLFTTSQWAFRNTGEQTYAPSSLPREPGADIKAAAAWDVTTGSADVIVAIVDSGVDTLHPELQGRVWTNTAEIPGNGMDDDGNGFIDDVHGYDFIHDDGDPSDDNGHGTSVCSVVGAVSNNGSLFAGLDWACRLLPVKVLDTTGLGYYTQIAAGVVYAADQGANVINLSLGGGSLSLALAEACAYAHDRGSLVVASMMNGNSNTPEYPAAFDESVTAVGATDPADDRCRPEVCGYGSNYGAHIDVVAPGVSIPILHYGSSHSYGMGAGTSFAAPMVSGLASLLLARDATLTPDQLRDVIRYSAADQVGRPEEDDVGFDIYHGFGRIDAARAMELSASARFPVLAAPDSVRAAEGTMVAFDVVVTDADGDPIESLAIRNDDKPLGATFVVQDDHRVGRFEWHPGYRDQGTYAIVFEARNPFQATATTWIEVLDVTDPPVVTAPFAMSGIEGDSVAIVVGATDPDGDPLTDLAAAPLPPGARFRAAPDWGSGLLEWRPSFTQAGTYPIDFTATSLDPRGPLGSPLLETGTARTYVRIAEGPNQPPLVSAPAAIEGAEGVPMTIPFLVTDPDGDEIVEVFAAPLPLGATLAANETKTEGAIEWTPGFTQAGTYEVTLSASSAYRPTPVSEPEILTGTTLVTLTIADMNRAPESRPGGPYVGVVGVPVPFDGSASSDPDGSPIVSYLWEFGDGATAHVPAPDHAYLQAGGYLASLTVTDGALAASGSADVSIAAFLPAAAFPDPADRVLRLMAAKPTACLQLEAAGASYTNDALDMASLTLAVEGKTATISALAAKSSVVADRNRNGVEEITVCFAKGALRELLADLPAGRHEVSVVLDGSLVTGTPVRAAFSWDVVAAGRRLAAAFAPSPVRREGVLTLRLTNGGRTLVRVFDVNGRLVRVLLDDVIDAPGYRDVPFQVQGVAGQELHSGIYFYRVDAAGAWASGKITVIR